MLPRGPLRPEFAAKLEGHTMPSGKKAAHTKLLTYHVDEVEQASSLSVCGHDQQLYHGRLQLKVGDQRAFI